MATPWSVPRDWVGETAAVLASGPSMSREVAAAVRGRCRVIAVNSEGLLSAPWAEVLYAADHPWWQNNPAALKFAGLKVTIRPPGGGHGFDSPEVLELKNGGPAGFDDRPTHLRTGGNSGFQAMHLAAHFGARRILLCGFDMHAPERGPAHWFGEHAWRRGRKSPYAMFVTRMTQSAPEFAARGIEVLNCTPGSALKCFPFLPLSEALNEQAVCPVRQGAQVRAGADSQEARGAGTANA